MTGEPGRGERAVYVWYTAYTASSHTGKYTAPPYLHLALGHRWPWDQVGGARVGRGTVALRCLGCLPTITSNISGVKDAQRSRRQSIWAVYTSLRHTAKYTGFGCIPYVYSLLASSRLACHAIQRIQPIQPYSHTRHNIIQRHTASICKSNYQPLRCLPIDITEPIQRSRRHLSTRV